ncbi:hypothetical protein P4T04_00580 [Bacillus badius]|uniref:hypothetical protein n=1 Tax=Bacillus badius TaxID=1455 RepID=UPI002E1A0E69|nr:hypothetical protein [Bacillus badius]
MKHFLFCMKAGMSSVIVAAVISAINILINQGAHLLTGAESRQLFSIGTGMTFIIAFLFSFTFFIEKSYK